MSECIPKAMMWFFEYLLVGMTIEGCMTVKGNVVPDSAYCYYVVNEVGRGVGDHLCIFDEKGSEIAYIPWGYLSPMEMANWVTESISAHKWATT
jgi:hypothetical protein